MSTENKLSERKRLEVKRSENRNQYELGNISYNDYSKMERRINRQFEVVLR